MALTKSELIDKMSAAADINKAQAERAYGALVEAVRDGVKAGDEVRLHDLGTFRVAERAARTGRNPQTGAEITIPAAKTVTFKAVSGLKDLANGIK